MAVLRSLLALLLLAGLLGCAAGRLERGALIGDAERTAPPAGIDPALWLKLNTELTRVLEARQASATGPVGNGSISPDFAIFDDGGTPTAHWSYRNQGDYNVDGVVNLGDLTPLGINFNKTSAAADWINAQRADGNGDGVVNIGDVTPLGQAFGARLDGWIVEEKLATPGALWTEVISIGPYTLPPVFSGYPAIGTGLPAVQFGASYRAVPLRVNGATPDYGPPSNEYLYGWAGLSSWPMDGANPKRRHQGGSAGPSALGFEWGTTLDGRTDYAQVAVDDYGQVYAATYDPGGPGGMLYALNRDGTLRWRFPTAAGLHTSPALNQRAGFNWVAVCDLDGMLYCLARDGKLRWKTALGAQSDRTAPLIDGNGDLYITLRNPGKLVRVNPAGQVQYDVAVVDTATGICLDEGGRVCLVDGSQQFRVFYTDGTSAYTGAAGFSSEGALCFGPNRAVGTAASTGAVHYLYDGFNPPLQYMTSGYFNNAPAYDSVAGVVYAGTYDPPTQTGELLALDSNCLLLWGVPLPATVTSDLALSPAGWVYFATQDPANVKGVQAIAPSHAMAWFYDTSPGRATGPAVCGAGRLVFAVDNSDGTNLRSAVVSIYTPSGG